VNAPLNLDVDLASAGQGEVEIVASFAISGSSGAGALEVDLVGVVQDGYLVLAVDGGRSQVVVGDDDEFLVGIFVGVPQEFDVGVVSGARDDYVTLSLDLPLDAGNVDQDVGVTLAAGVLNLSVGVQVILEEDLELAVDLARAAVDLHQGVNVLGVSVRDDAVGIQMAGFPREHVVSPEVKKNKNKKKTCF